MTSLLDILRREDEAVKRLKEANREFTHMTSLSKTGAVSKSVSDKWIQEAKEERQKAFAEFVHVRQELRQYFADLQENNDLL